MNLSKSRPSEVTAVHSLRPMLGGISSNLPGRSKPKINVSVEDLSVIQRTHGQRISGSRPPTLSPWWPSVRIESGEPIAIKWMKSFRN